MIDTPLSVILNRFFSSICSEGKHKLFIVGHVRVRNFNRTQIMSSGSDYCGLPQRLFEYILSGLAF